MTAFASTASGRLDIGKVVADTFNVLGRRWPVLFGLGLVTWVLSLMNSYISGHAMSVAGSARIANGGFPFFTSYHYVTNPASYVGSLIAGLVGCFVIACQVHIAVGELEGRSPSLAEAAQLGVRKFLLLLLLLILWGIGVGVGLVLLIVPGLILMTMWSVVTPVLVAETNNVIEAFGASSRLTAGNRWRVFGLLLFTMVAMVVLEGVASAVARAVFGLPTDVSGRVGLLAVSSFVSFVMGVVIYVGLGALYVQLRGMKHGLGDETAAEVFA